MSKQFKCPHCEDRGSRGKLHPSLWLCNICALSNSTLRVETLQILLSYSSLSANGCLNQFVIFFFYYFLLKTQTNKTSPSVAGKNIFVLHLAITKFYLHRITTELHSFNLILTIKVKAMHGLQSILRVKCIITAGYSLYYCSKVLVQVMPSSSFFQSISQQGVVV